MPREKSIIKRAISSDGGIRVIFCDSTAVVRRSCEIHHTSKTMTATLGRALTATSLMSSLLKDRDNTLTLQFRGDGPAGSVVCVGDYKGNVRGYADHMEFELQPNAQGKLNVGGAIGRGSLYVIKDLGMSEPYVGVSPIVSGEIAEDITEYFASSEQTPTVCALGVRVDHDNMCFAAGGYLVQLMPGYDENDIEKLETNVKMAGSVSKQIADGLDGDEIIAMLFDGIEYEMFDEFDIEYLCPCERDRYLRALISLNEHDMQELYDAGEPVETRCQFCGKKYVFELDELRAAREAAKARKAEETKKAEESENHEESEANGKE
ncbi:MAG: Hsp33 family molecular chaperone HslO [Clostridia bacterium]|nr:Hsp33 family molecular chaperone HslO [Clostridia bacterium]MBQ4351006.1 Hsp33 family molecular chaperone HslO [Clostridia bacterium]